MVKQPNDSVLDALRKANPVPEGSTAGWHATNEGKRVAAIALVDVLEAPPPSERPGRKRVIRVLVAAALAVSAIAAGFRLGSGDTGAQETVICHDQLLQEAGGAVIPLLGRSPTQACAVAWYSAFRQPAPARLTACINIGGGISVYAFPKDLDEADVCPSVGTVAFDPHSASP